MIKITDSPTCPVGSQRLFFGVPRTAPLAPTINRSPSGFTTLPLHRFAVSPFHYQMGFSLLEIMVAVVILGFGLLATMHLFPIGLRASRISQDVTTATFLAQQRIELLKSTKYKDIETGDDSGTFEGPYSEFSWEEKVSEEFSTGEGKKKVVWLKKVTVKVSWDRYGKTRRLKLVTLLANYESKFKKQKHKKGKG